MLEGRKACDRRLKLAALGAVLAMAVSLAVAGSASAFSFDSFITQGNASAGWVVEPSVPPGATDQQSMRLFVNGTSSTDFDDAARGLFKDFAATPDPTPPSFDYKTTIAGRSEGSPRFLITFNDGGKGELRPATLVADQWTHVSGLTPDWDTTGGTCGSQTQWSVTYSQVLACHPGATITGMEVLNDSGWKYPGGFQLLVDNITYGGNTISAPAPPALGSSFNVTPTSGTVNVRVGARNIARLEGTDNLPVGSTVDTRRGHAKLVSSRGRRNQAANFTGGIFKVKQSRSRRKRGLTDLILSGNLLGCSAGGAGLSSARGDERAETARRRRRRRLWGRGRGRFRTRGRYSSGSVRGTKWLTADSCSGTLTVVREGVVAVRDFGLKKTILVRAPGRYLAKKKK